jgi:hypothetical protein
LKLMPFMGERRINWIRERYDLYRKRAREGLVAGALALIFSLSTLLVVPFFPSQIRLPVDGVLIAIALPAFGVMSYLINRDVGFYLPEIEDRLLCFLKPAVDSLGAYVSYGKKYDKKKSLKNVRLVANVLQQWYLGNLKFITNGPVGKMLSDLQENFRRGLLPALRDVEKTDKSKLQDILVVLTNMEKVVEQTNSIDSEHLDTWSRMLSRYPPSVEPPRPFWRRIPAKKSDLSIVTMLIVIPIVVGWVGVAILRLPIEAAYLGGIAMFGAMGGLMLYVQNRKKGS